MNVVTIIQARMGSNRLPGKVLMKIKEKSILEHVINFLNLSKLVEIIVVATTNLPEDDQIEKLCHDLNIKCFRGNPENVLERYYQCAKLFDADLIVRLTGDDPLIDPKLVDSIIYECQNGKYDYASNVLHQTYPIGYSPCEVFTFKTLKDLYNNQKDPMSTEHVTYYIRKNPNFYKIKEFSAPVNLSRPNWRLTIDYKEDFQLMSEIFSKLYSGPPISYESLVDLLEKNPELLKINEKYR